MKEVTERALAYYQDRLIAHGTLRELGRRVCDEGPQADGTTCRSCACDAGARVKALAHLKLLQNFAEEVEAIIEEVRR